MSAPRDLPGLYYDADKRRYFPVQPDHQAPRGVAYSRSAVNASTAAAERVNVLTQRQKREKTGRINRINPSSYTRINLHMRHGGHNAVALLAGNYAANLQSRCAQTRPTDSINALALNRGRVYCGISSDRYSGWCLNEENPRSMFTLGPLGLGWPQIGLASTGGDYLATYLGPGLHVFSPYGDSSTSAHIADTIWDIAGTLEPIIALATTDGLNIREATNAAIDLASLRTQRGLPRKEQMVVTFQDPHTVISGQRSGRVNFTDIRAAGTVYRVHHSSAVNGITTARSVNQIIVSGLETTSIYDLRYTKPAHSLNPSGRHKRRPKASEPFICFCVPPERHSTHYGSGKALAYLASHDIAVLASHRSEATSVLHQNKITLFQCSTGRILPSSTVDTVPLPEIKDLAVGRVRDGPESIFVATPKRLYEWNVDVPYDPDVKARTIPQAKTRPSNWPNDDGVYMIHQECFPPDSRPDVVQKWERGDEGPG